MPSKRREIQTWINKQKKAGKPHGVRAAANSFHMDVDDVRYALGLPLPKSRRKKKAQESQGHTAAEIADMDRGAYLRHQLVEAHEDIAATRKAKSWTALIHARKYASGVRDQLDEHRVAEQEEGYDPTDIEDLVAEVIMLGDDILKHPSLVDAVALAASGVH